MTEDEAKRFIEKLNDANYDLVTKLAVSVSWNIVLFCTTLVLAIIVLIK
jgi:hypothetical protein